MTHFLCGGLVFLPLTLSYAAAAGFASTAEAPAKVESIKIVLTVTEATYDDDLGTDTVNVRPADFESGMYSYERTSTNVGRLSYNNVPSGINSYSGAFELTFTSATKGTFVDTYTGSYSGVNRGTFELAAVDVDARPLAKSQTVEVVSGVNKKFQLRGTGLDYPKSELKFEITEKPTVGKLVTENLPQVVYKPKAGFTGTVKFKFIVKEGGTKSKPAIVTLQVVKGRSLPGL